MILSWTPSPGATKYNIEIADNVGFTGAIKDTTASTTYVPTAKLKPGTWYWHVQAVNASNEASGWTFSDISVDNVATPILNSPSDGATLNQPNDAPLLTWSMPAGAGSAGASGVDSYKIEVSNNNFTTVKSYTTKSTSLVVSDPLSLGTWKWQVTAVKSTNPLITSAPSNPRSFAINALAEPVITGPVQASLTDVVLDWEPVNGAKGYELQVSKTTDFSGALVDSRMGNDLVLGTKYSPPVTYDNNNTYYWQVRAVDSAGNSSDWAQSGSPFKRNYPYAPSLVYPAIGDQNVPAPYYFDWTSVRHASRYEFQISTNENMTAASTCMVAGTSYTPGVFRYRDTEPVLAIEGPNEDCDVAEGVTNYWRVRALDRPFKDPNDPLTIEGIEGDDWSPRGSFKATGMAITGIATSRAGLPTISWNPVRAADHYTVSLTGPATKNVTTRATSWTADGTTKLPAGTYTLNLSAVTLKGVSSLVERRDFTVSETIPGSGADPLTLLEPASGVEVADVPLMKWEPMPSAAYYKVFVTDSDGAGVVGIDSLFEKPVPYPTMTDTSVRLLKKPGLYHWRVRAYGADNSLLGASGEGDFTVGLLAPVTGNELALTGQELDHNTPAGTRQPCTTAPSSGPCVVPATPVFRWSPVPNASFYAIYVAEDANFTQLIEPTFIAATTNTMWSLQARDLIEWSLADSESTGPEDPTSYYWYVMPCRSLDTCGPNPRSANVAQHTFTKKSPAVTGQQTTQTEGKEVTFKWDDYWHDAASSNPADKWARTAENLPQSAMQYRIEVSKDTTFAGNMLVDRIEVDQTTYTSFTKSYEPGTYYWRVQAIDDFGNALTWSDFDPATPQRENAVFTVAPAKVSLTAPVADATASGTVAFTWQAQAYAKGYDIEVYKNDDSTFSGSNRIAFQQFNPGPFGTGGVLNTAWTWNSVLPPSSSAYLWRVRRVDSSGNAGPWSDAGRFFVTGAALSITSPLDGGAQPPDAPVLRWTQVPGASTYAVDLRPQSGGTGTTDAGTSIGTAFASKKAFTTGTYLGSVTAKDASGNSMGTAQVTFTVDSRLIAVNNPVISAPSGTGVGATLTSTDPIWNKPGVVMGYQWLRNDALIGGATGTTYTLTAADVGKSIALRVSGKLPSYSDGAAVSNALAVQAAPGGGTAGTLSATAAPVINGTAKVGGYMTATAGTWNSAPTGFRYQWYRAGAPIAGATTSIYRATEADALQPLTVVVSVSKANWTDGSATTAPVVVAKLSSTTSAILLPTILKPGQRSKLMVTVMAIGLTGPTGTLTVKDGRKTLVKKSLTAAKLGKLTIRLKGFKAGKHKLKVSYSGSAAVNSSASKVIKFTVKR